MSFNYKLFPATTVSSLVYSVFGLSCLIIVYGIMGAVRTFVRFIILRPRRFFYSVQRPTPPAKALDPIYGTHQMMKLKSSGISLHYVSKGLPNQPMILFIHGFPECWYSWRYQMRFFSKDFRVIAIDQRGYGLSSKPPFVTDYRLEILAGDIADMIEQLGYESCVLVGHDIGGSVAWLTALLYPHLVEKLIVINSPHPMVFRQDLSLKQVRRSWELFFNQIPLLPELVLQSNDFSKIEHILRTKPTGMINRDQINDEDLEVYKYTFSQPGTAKAALNYLRALFRFPLDYSCGVVSTPVLLIWGCQDSLYEETLADLSQKYCSDIRLKKIPSSSRWTNQDVHEMVNTYIDLFLKEFSPIEHTYEF